MAGVLRVLEYVAPAQWGSIQRSKMTMWLFENSEMHNLFNLEHLVVNLSDCTYKYLLIESTKAQGKGLSKAGSIGILILSTKWWRVPEKTLMISQQSDANLLHTQRDRSIIPTGLVLSPEHFQKWLFIYLFLFQNASASHPYRALDTTHRKCHN